MLDFDAGKLIVIGVVALVVIGPKDLPRVMRQVGQTVGKLRRMAAEFQHQFMDAMREADMADVKEEMTKIAETAKIDVAFDPVRDIRNQIGGALEKPADITPSLAATESPAAAIDIHEATSPEAMPASEPLPEGGLVGAGIGPAAPDVTEPAVAATLDDVKQALDENLASVSVTGESPDKPVKEHTA